MNQLLSWIGSGTLSASLVAVVGCSNESESGAPIDMRRSYLLGVNYPWNEYGHDFGENEWGHDGASSHESRGKSDADFAYLASQQVRVVRWFLFADCRASPEFNIHGEVTGLDSRFYRDRDFVVKTAEKHNLYLILVLFDFRVADNASRYLGVQVFGRSQKELRASLIKCAVRPVLKRYANRRHIIAWDVMNEPEWAMDVHRGRTDDTAVSVATMQSFVAEILDEIHTHTSQLATVGSASKGMLDRYWRDSNVDFFSFTTTTRWKKSIPWTSHVLTWAYTNPASWESFQPRARSIL